MRKYNFLSKRLWPVADNIIDYFINTQGLSKRKFNKEKPILPQVEYATTLFAITKDYHFLCIEIIDNKYPNALDDFVFDCSKKSLPVRLFIAFPKDQLNDTEYRAIVGRAKKRSIGILEVRNGNVTQINDALSLSSIGLQEIDTKKFPAKYRADLSRAEGTFRNGDPAKGCLNIYEEIESLSRSICKKTREDGYWRNPKRGEKIPHIQYDRTPWANIMKVLYKYLDFAAIKRICPEIDDLLIAKVLSITKERNETGHKIRNPNDLKRRDSRLKIRFEVGVDLLMDLIKASKPIKV